ncbi:MAG TPA: hypothetical protein VFQ53_28250 [Kofleriaceae bacterium]|nr:hypothetical protein [Kofleriaceae bacterium]
MQQGVWWSSVVVLVACGGPDEYPPISEDIDAPRAIDARPIDAGADAALAAGRVCLISDLRVLDACAASGAGGLTVTVDGVSSTTNADGSFLYSAPGGAATWTVTGGTIVKSVVPLAGGADVLLPAITTADYTTLVDANLATVGNGQGSVVVSLTKNSSPVVGATVVVNLGEGTSLYDTTSATTWGRTSTGALGMAWLPGHNVGSRTLIITPAGSTGVTKTVSVVDQAITFVTFAL